MKTSILHPFEEAGLGLAPFRCIGVVSKVGPIRTEIDGVTFEVGAPGQPMGVCNFCGTGIRDCYVIRSADKKIFEVGCDCVAKVMRETDTTLSLDVRREKRKLDRAKAQIKRESKYEKTLARVRAVRELLAADPALLTDRPHPYAERGPFFASKTERDYAEFLLSSGGDQGKNAGARMIEQAHKAKTETV